MNTRRLAGILVADAVGFTQRMAADEAQTLQAVSGALAVLTGIITQFDGRTVKTMGDGLLAEFASVVNAVSAAAEIQRTLAKTQDATQGNAPFMFRIGVHLGDIVVQDNGDIMGDGVNVAARLEQQAAPGSVLISSQVFDHVDGKTAETFNDKGPLTLKGISRNMRAYELVLPQAVAGASAPAEALPILPDKPSIAVLPFENMSSDSQQEYFVDGLTEDLTIALSEAAALFVIARNSSFSYKGTTPDLRVVGRELGVKYVVSGGVRASGARLRVTAALSDTQTGQSVWSRRLDGGAEDVFDFQDQIVEAVVGATLPSIQSNEVARAASKRPDDLTAYDRMLQAVEALNRGAPVDAIPPLDEAIARDPGYGKALALRAWCNTLRTTWDGDADSAKNIEEGIALAERALAAARGDPEVEAYGAYVLSFFGADTDRGFRMLRSVVDRCPNFVWALVSLAAQEAIRGDAEIAVALCAQAERLNPRDPMAFRLHSTKALASWARCDWEGLLAHATRTLSLMPDMLNMRAHVIVGLSELGRTQEAKAEAKAFMTRWPDYNLATHEERLSAQKNLAGPPLDTWLARLRQAGIPG